MTGAADDAWPLRMTTLPPTEKTKWMLRDPDRYFRRCWLERTAEAQVEVRQRLDEMAASRRRRAAGSPATDEETGDA